MLISEIQDALSRLFSEQDFKTCHYEEIEAGRCFVVLCSRFFKIKIMRNIVDLEIRLGELSAANSWDDSVLGKRIWYGFDLIVGFVNKDYSMDESKLFEYSVFPSENEILFDFQNAIVANMPGINDFFQTFGSSEQQIEFAEYQEILDKKISELTRKRYGL
jgi:hypothetical protein